MLKKRAARSKPSKLDKGKNDRVGIAIVMVLVGIPLCVSVAFVPLLSRFDEVYQFVTTAEIDKVGSFLGAIGGPLALYLIFLGLLLQSRQFLLLSDQVNMLRKQHEDEYQRSLPRLILQEIGLSGESRQFVIRNIGGAARELQLEWGDWDNVASSDKKSQQLEKLEADDHHLFEVPDTGPARSYRYRAVFISDRGEKFYQDWKIRRTGGSPPFETEKLTNGPTPLEG